MTPQQKMAAIANGTMHLDPKGEQIPVEEFITAKRMPSKPGTITSTVREFGDYMQRLMEWMRSGEEVSA